LPGEVAANGFPSITLIITAEDLVGREVDPLVGMRADEQGRIPVPAQRRFALARLRLNAHALAGAAIVANQHPVLRFRVNGIRVLGIDARLEAVAHLRDKPVGVCYAVRAAVANRPAHGGVVLRAAVNVIERRVLVHGHVIKLRNRQIALKLPVLGAVEAFIDAAVAADQIVVGIVRIDPQGVIVHVFELLA
jgi:hypothetical protein